MSKPTALFGAYWPCPITWELPFKSKEALRVPYRMGTYGPFALSHTGMKPLVVLARAAWGRASAEANRNSGLLLNEQLAA